MLLYLMQHAEAVPEEVDPQRPLSEDGRAAIERVAARAARHALPIEHIYHSNKLRARQTAELLGKALHLESQVETLEGLNPKDRAEPLARWLRVETQKAANTGLALVSHQYLRARACPRAASAPEAKGRKYWSRAGQPPVFA